MTSISVNRSSGHNTPSILVSDDENQSTTTKASDQVGKIHIISQEPKLAKSPSNQKTSGQVSSEDEVLIENIEDQGSQVEGIAVRDVEPVQVVAKRVGIYKKAEIRPCFNRLWSFTKGHTRFENRVAQFFLRTIAILTTPITRIAAGVVLIVDTQLSHEFNREIYETITKIKSVAYEIVGAPTQDARKILKRDLELFFKEYRIIIGERLNACASFEEKCAVVEDAHKALLERFKERDYYADGRMIPRSSMLPEDETIQEITEEFSRLAADILLESAAEDLSDIYASSDVDIIALAKAYLDGILSTATSIHEDYASLPEAKTGEIIEKFIFGEILKNNREKFAEELHQSKIGFTEDDYIAKQIGDNKQLKALKEDIEILLKEKEVVENTINSLNEDLEAHKKKAKPAQPKHAVPLKEISQRLVGIASALEDVDSSKWEQADDELEKFLTPEIFAPILEERRLKKTLIEDEKKIINTLSEALRSASEKLEEIERALKEKHDQVLKLEKACAEKAQNQWKKLQKKQEALVLLGTYEEKDLSFVPRTRKSSKTEELGIDLSQNEDSLSLNRGKKKVSLKEEKTSSSDSEKDASLPIANNKE